LEDPNYMEHADQILPQPSEGPTYLVLLKDLLPAPLGPWWTGPHLVIFTMPTAVKLNGNPKWQHLSRIKHCPPTSDSPTAPKDEYSCILLDPMSICISHTLSLPSIPE
uniref:Murine leukemia virus integrase C-terminal domain-containing protein n=1 Tax=Castor canadensis TaxID=51338 RepID=A0A8C0ZPR2_CASCN